MNIKIIKNYDNDQNSYLIYDDEKNALLIDAGCYFDDLIEEIKDLKVDLKKVYLTHCHYDHIMCLNEIRENFDVRVGASFECSNNIKNPSINLSGLFYNPIKCEIADEILVDNCVEKVGNIKIKTIKTPGHTNGGVCFLIDNYLFSGDTLFLRNVGRWDLPTGDENILKESIINKLYCLDDDIIVYPGHGNETKIYYEKRYNTYVRG